jgi:flavin reductase (DIM6/NTAB) family NADH-FMN oxidoreductase RutF
MRRLASAVAVVTAQGDDGPVGMAATSITSLTLEPPAVLACVNRATGLHACLSVGAAICVNLLSADQHDVSFAFGGGQPRERRFETGDWCLDLHGLPMLEGAQANLSCRIESIVPYGTHSIVIGRVAAVRLGGPIAPLIYQNGAYL